MCAFSLLGLDASLWEQSDDEILQRGTEADLEELEIRFTETEVINRQRFLAQYMNAHPDSS